MASKKTEYTVIGNHAVHGHEPGESFMSDMSDEAAAHLIDSGHLAVGKRPSEG